MFLLIDRYANGILVIVAIIGTYFVRTELKELRIQNSYTEVALTQSDRPILYLESSEDDSIKWVQYGRNQDIFFRIDLSIDVINRGKGPLFFIGNIQYCTNEEIDFRGALLSNKVNISPKNFDRRFSFLRSKPLLIGDVEHLKLVYDNVNISAEDREKYYYSLLFYRDIKGNLYDTEILHYVRYAVDSEGAINEEFALPTESFHSYPQSEIEQLVKNVMSQHEGFARAIRGQK